MSTTGSKAISMERIIQAIDEVDLDFIEDNQEALQRFSQSPELRKLMPLNLAMQRMEGVLNLGKRGEGLEVKASDEVIKEASYILNDSQDIIEILQNNGFREFDQKMAERICATALEVNTQTAEFLQDRGLASLDGLAYETDIEADISIEQVLQAIDNVDLKFITDNRDAIATLAQDSKMQRDANGATPCDHAIDRIGKIFDMFRRGAAIDAVASDEVVKEAADLVDNSFGIIQLLSQSGFSTFNKKAAHELCAKAGEVYLDAVGYMEQMGLSDPKEGLLYAAAKGMTGSVNNLISNGLVDPTEAFLYGAAKGMTDSVENLINSRIVNINSRMIIDEPDGSVGIETCVTEALKNGHYDLAEKLAKHKDLEPITTEIAMAAQAGLSNALEAMVTKTIALKEKGVLVGAFKICIEPEFNPREHLPSLEMLLAAGVKIGDMPIKTLPKDTQKYLNSFSKVCESSRAAGVSAAQIMDQGISPENIDSIMPKQSVFGKALSVFGIRDKAFDSQVARNVTNPSKIKYNDKRAPVEGEWQKTVARQRSDSIETNRTGSSVSL